MRVFAASERFPGHAWLVGDMGVVIVAPTTQGPNCILFTTTSVYTFP